MKVKIRRALISVSDKTGLEPLVKKLHQNGVNIISSGGTGAFIKDLGVPVTPIQEVTGNPEAFAGRMKTLSFQVSSALLFRRDSKDDQKEAKELNIEPIDLVVCNLYPFEKVAKEKSDLDVLIENIDIGGPTMVRAAAKNYKHVTISTDPSQYLELIKELEENNCEVTIDLRKKFSLDAFRKTAIYDSVIAGILEERSGIEERTIGLTPLNAKVLRYGENPHQKGWVYANPVKEGIASLEPIQGKAISFNNLLDSDAAWRSASDIRAFAKRKNGDQQSVVTIIKHSNPCGAALSKTPLMALELAWAGDPISAFGGIVCFTDTVDEECADWLSNKFVEVVLAPSFTKEAKEIFSKKKNLRLLEVPPQEGDHTDCMIRSISGGWVVQTEDNGLDQEFQNVTEKVFPEDKMDLSNFGTMVTKHLRSNAISLVKKDDRGYYLIGAGMGNPNRVISMAQAIEKAEDNGHKDLSDSILISDAFFPFRDNIDLANKAGIKFIVQPGGSIKDNDVKMACNELEIAMVLTGRRHFRH